MKKNRAEHYHWKAMVLAYRIDKLETELAQSIVYLPKSGHSLLQLMEQRLAHCLKMESYFV